MDNEEEYWPDRIIAEKRITYLPLIIKEQLEQDNDVVVSFEEVLDVIRSYVYEDFGCENCGQPSAAELIIYDPDGDEY